METNKLVEQVLAGFDALRDEYQKLHSQHARLEQKLATTREQYNRLAKLCNDDQLRTPPLSLSSSPSFPTIKTTEPRDAVEILRQSGHEKSRAAAEAVSKAINARDSLQHHNTSHGVKIWSGSSADYPDIGSSAMPSISESPLEQDFTVEGKPSSLGCPFASMAGRKLNSHAASVLSRYNSNPHSSNESIASRITGRDNLSQHRTGRQHSRRGSIRDPIRAEICGLADHNSPQTDVPAETVTPEVIETPDVGVCPIRFLDQHSPEEVATYFEKHKHELPRSHEVCVMRYQSNEKQIKELDAKYGSIVSMIQGLGQKHKVMLPKDPDETAGDDADAALSDEKVRKWASSVSLPAISSENKDYQPEPGDLELDADRQPRFERPLRDIRVGESPSRPWGISVPTRYLEKAESGISSRPAQIGLPADEDAAATLPPHPMPVGAAKCAKCPFGSGAMDRSAVETKLATQTVEPVYQHEYGKEPAANKFKGKNESDEDEMKQKMNQTVFTGPVFFGYSAEEATKILREGGWTRTT